MTELETNQRAAVVAAAMSWLRTPYHHQAGVKGAGCDCAFLLVRVFAECGLVPEIDPRPYPPDWHLHRDEERYLGWVERYAQRVQVPLPGDVALWRFGRTVSHGGIVVAWPTIIHAYRGEGVVLENAAHGRLAEPGRLHGFFSVFFETPPVAAEPDLRKDL
ncbi:MAG TPA: hypothetical protein VJ924_14580 [Alphaproteobacteria bacterium]|nr:hypothetical protein [Alphaproteobacteria bacterium]